MKKKIFLTLLCSIFLITLASFIYDLQDGMILWGDTKFHILRIYGINENITNGMNNYINPLYNNHLGYGSPIFYSDFMIYIPVYIFSKITTNMVFVFNLIIIYYLFITYFISTFSYYKIRNNIIEANLFAILFTFCNYHIFNIFNRGALSEYIAMSFLPLFILSIYMINQGLKEKSNGKEYIYFIISMLTVIFSHALTSIMIFYLYIISFVIIMVFNRKRIGYIFKNLIISSIFILGMSSLYLLPLLEQVLFQKFYYQMESHQWAELTGYTLTQMIDVFTTFDGIVNCFVFIPIVMLVFIIIKRKSNLFINIIFSLLIISILCISSFVPMENIPLLDKIQFQWRFSEFIWLFATFLSVYSLKYITFLTKYRYIKIILIIIMLSFPVIYNFTVREYILEEGISSVATIDDVDEMIGRGQEYIPGAVDFNYISNFSNNDIVESYDEGVYNIEIMKKSDEYELPILYYKGYTSDSNIEISESENGLVLVKTLEDMQSFNIYYGQTQIQLIAKIIFLVFLISCSCYYYILYTNKTKLFKSR